MASVNRGARQYQGIAVLLLIALVYIVLSRHVISMDTLVFFAVLIPSIILHEVSHGVVALAFGDDTAKRAGRLTLNPLAHIDPFGTIILPALMLLVGFGAIGYAKPVPVNVGRLRHPRNESLLVSLVGPAVNIVLAVAAALAYRVVVGSTAIPLDSHGFPQQTLPKVLLILGFANVILAVFNLIPIPPLDGSAVVERVLPRSWWPGYLRIRQFSLPLVLILVLLAPQVLTRIFDPALNLWSNLLG
ncbi:MAG TPA: site-2 protease family protein [Acidimicrobiales bacterium]|jgi:Zn-dependent protease